MEKVNTYTEISPSGEGLHLYLKLSDPLTLIANKKAPYECYTEKRFFTVTGKPYGEEKQIRTITAQDARSLLALIGYPWGKDKEEVTRVPPNPNNLQYNEVIEKMFAARNGYKVKKLWDGDTSNNNGDDSAADLALVSHLAFWTGGDSVKIEELWLSSPLGQREKTQKRQDYRNLK